MRKKTIKITPKLLKTLKRFHAGVMLAQDDYWEQIDEMEKKLAKATGIKDIEVFHIDNEAVGIGNRSRTMPLVCWEEMD